MSLQDCSICWGKVEENTKITTQCNHVFHKNCLNKWLNKQQTCPYCRQECLYIPVYYESYIMDLIAEAIDLGKNSITTTMKITDDFKDVMDGLRSGGFCITNELPTIPVVYEDGFKTINIKISWKL